MPKFFSEKIIKKNKNYAHKLENFALSLLP